MIKPPKLNPGDKIATVSLSWGGPSVFPHRYEIGMRQLKEEFGLEVVEMPNTLRDADWLAKNPKARAEDWMQAFTDPSIKGIFATIGGDDSIRLLPFIDFDIIRKHPKIFLGYSDITISHLMCYKAGLVSFYGPSIMVEFAENAGIFPYVIESLRKTLFSSQPMGELQPSTEGWTVERLDWGDPASQQIKRKLNPSMGWKFLQGNGTWRGHLIGGCLDVLDWARGTEIFPDNWQNAILFFETSEEAPPPEYVKRTLRVFAAMGILEKISGILFGRPGGEIPLEKFEEYDQAILQVVKEEEGLTDLPVVTNMDFGHTSPMLILPYGVQAEIDCDTKRLSILENAVTE
ncbi:MAG TPA: S66 peptidase family protein [Anaerolineales bacterium]|jgi:muramoyltetrapeptide carboxypeptidase LdcA involved in peptidoglycan recycling|nr:S66 peptidase family protein [Anaerolineales bacterium]